MIRNHTARTGFAALALAMGVIGCAGQASAEVPRTPVDPISLATGTDSGSSGLTLPSGSSNFLGYLGELLAPPSKDPCHGLCS
ncbi:hypothetical protein ACFXPS_17680 [Nocardia sp. NPDC059091]|uniref:hypothetical protein n=1 Tax=unclassified Nocardia TaxID=2637762 RepID=UPI0036CA9F9C